MSAGRSDVQSDGRGGVDFGGGGGAQRVPVAQAATVSRATGADAPPPVNSSPRRGKTHRIVKAMTAAQLLVEPLRVKARSACVALMMNGLDAPRRGPRAQMS